jgi:hypothetical protein
MRDPSSPGERAWRYPIFEKQPKVIRKVRLVNRFHYVGEFAWIDRFLTLELSGRHG